MINITFQPDRSRYKPKIGEYVAYSIRYDDLDYFVRRYQKAAKKRRIRNKWVKRFGWNVYLVSSIDPKSGVVTMELSDPSEWIKAR